MIGLAALGAGMSPEDLDELCWWLDHQELTYGSPLFPHVPALRSLAQAIGDALFGRWG